MKRAVRLPALFAVVLGLAAAPRAAAQDPEEHPGVLRPVESLIGPREAWAPAATWQAGADATRRMADAVTHAPAVAHPVGYDVLLRRVMGGSAETRRLQPGISGFLFLYFRDEQTGRTEAGSEGPAFSLSANTPLDCAFPDASQPYDEDEQGPVYFEPKADGEDHGYAHYPAPPGGGCTLLTRISRPLWLPVSRERILRHMIATRRKALDDFEAQLKQMPAQMVASVDVAALRRPVEHSLRAAEAALASLSPAERGEQAYFLAGGPPEGGDVSVPVGGARDAGGVALVMPNPAFLDSTAPPGEVQTISLRVFMVESEQWYAPFKGEAFRRIHDGLDWAALAALLK